MDALLDMMIDVYNRSVERDFFLLLLKFKTVLVSCYLSLLMCIYIFNFFSLLYVNAI